MFWTTFTEDDVSLNSYLYLPNDENNDVENLPAVLLFPEWWGLTEHIKDKAKALAKAGYVALAVDMYGNGRVTSDAQIANERMGELLQHPDLLLERVQLAYNNLRAVAEVNPNKMAALGFCFGGRVVLDMARDGMDLCGVVSFHGMLQHPKHQRKKVQSKQKSWWNTANWIRCVHYKT